ncbi:MAG: carbon storage regulator, CsrA [Acidimicrobiales bacterium]|nr:carbon storage regulator, CsrA [Acidimicrobiales bacterium]
MLVLTRREGETFTLGDDIEIEILDIKPGVVRVGIRAPRSVRVLRSELVEAVAAANAAAAVSTTIDTSGMTAEASPVTRS